MTDGRRARPAWDLGIGQFHVVGQLFRERSQAAPQDDRYRWLQFRAASDVPDRLFDHNSIPAMQADMKLAIDPAATARKPNRARSDLRFGASAPMPPI